MNSFYGGGKEGVSDTFGSALWCLDYLFDLASHGCRGANLETDVNQLGFISFYSPIVHDAAGVCSARPEYYGMLAFATAPAAANCSRPSSRRVRRWATEKRREGDVNLTAYATRDGQGTVYLTAINKDLARDATVECPLPEGCSRRRGVPPARPARSTPRRASPFAGAAVADDGSWSPGPAEVVPVAAGVARVGVPHASAVVVRFGASEKFYEDGKGSVGLALSAKGRTGSGSADAMKRRALGSRVISAPATSRHPEVLRRILSPFVPLRLRRTEARDKERRADEILRRGGGASGSR